MTNLFEGVKSVLVKIINHILNNGMKVWTKLYIYIVNKEGSMLTF